MFDVVLLSLVQVDLDEPAAVQFHSDPLTHDLTGEHQVLQDGVMDSGQSAAVELGERKKVINASFPTPFSFSVCPQRVSVLQFILVLIG